MNQVELSVLTAPTVGASGLLVMAGQPDVGDTILIGSVTYTFVAIVDFDTDGEISIGTNQATATANIIAAVNGSDAVNTPNPDATASAATADVAIDAIADGSVGNSIATVYTPSGASTNAFDDPTLLGGDDGGTFTSAMDVAGEVVGIGLILAAADTTIVVNIDCLPVGGYAPVPVLSSYAPGANTDRWVFPRKRLQTPGAVNLGADITDKIPMNGPLRLTVAAAGDNNLVRALVMFKD